MENNDKRVLRVELNDDVKRVSITGTDSDEKVVMRQELSEDELDMATGGVDRSTVTDGGVCATDLPHGEGECLFLWAARTDVLEPIEGHAGGPVHVWR